MDNNTIMAINLTNVTEMATKLYNAATTTMMGIHLTNAAKVNKHPSLT